MPALSMSYSDWHHRYIGGALSQDLYTLAPEESSSSCSFSFLVLFITVQAFVGVLLILFSFDHGFFVVHVPVHLEIRRSLICTENADGEP